jgi:hypothetical protein
MVKTHNVTGLKYLCITKRENWIDYPGSGTRWKNHIARHGNDISTELIFESDDYSTFVEVCIETSNILNVALSEEFANVIPEAGYDNGEFGEPNVVTFWKYASEERKREIYAARAKTLKNGGHHWANGDKRKEILDKISEKNKAYFENMTLDERRQISEKARKAAAEFFANKESERYKKWKENLSIMLKHRLANIPKEVLSESIRQRRLSLSPEAKEARKRKIQAVYATGKHDHLFQKMSEERKGINNPAARKICWMGKIYAKLEFEKLFGKITNEKNQRILEERDDCYLLYSDDTHHETITCPHCGQSTSKKPSAFKRWHFDNCKKRNNYEKISISA